MSAGRTSSTLDKLQHAAGYYRSENDLVQQIAPLLRDGLERGDAIALAVQSPVERALRDLFGTLPDVLQLDHPGGPQDTSGQSMVTRRARQLDQLRTTSATITAITQHDSRFDGADGRFWTSSTPRPTSPCQVSPCGSPASFPSRRGTGRSSTASATTIGSCWSTAC